MSLFICKNEFYTLKMLVDTDKREKKNLGMISDMIGREKWRVLQKCYEKNWCVKRSLLFYSGFIESLTNCIVKCECNRKKHQTELKSFHICLVKK